MARTKPDNEFVTWDCCGNRWELILTRLHPERDIFQPLCGDCGKRLLPGLLQYRVQLRAELAREIGSLRAPR